MVLPALPGRSCLWIVIILPSYKPRLDVNHMPHNAGLRSVYDARLPVIAKAIDFRIDLISKAEDPG
ncbi:hypothetical protein CPC16_004930, partial [Podila verticillata]